MGFRNMLNSRLTAVVAGSAAIAVLGASAGYAGGQIGTKDIKDDSVRSKDIRDGTIRNKDMRKGAQQGEPGPQGPEGPPGAGAAHAGPEWSIVDRNVLGNGDSFLRSGPDGAPHGVGSLGMRTGSGDDKAAFGNQVDFVGDPLAGLETVKYSVYTTGENNARYAENNPGVTVEIDPSGDADTAPNYASLVYVPGAAESNKWTELDASTADRWFLTGAAATSSGCTQADYCTLDEVQAEFAEATIFTVQVTKGRDYAFSGAVDALQLNETTFDFEPNGVKPVTQP